ncbi:hypothetical protein GLOIN_2v1789591 [Rhizophagus clarus]|uniref:Uncharacterized protein n=1 Tax=Rhizophagus clarus TaxID=94130 RepID=A0A8H3QWV3_9GLOM|nr:hypothetical protein GLOIN_2v1789591 [Rhizophagus clarus]
MESDQPKALRVKHPTALTNIPPKSTSSKTSSSESSSSESSSSPESSSSETSSSESSSSESSSSETSSSESSSSDSDIDEIVNMIKHQRIRKRQAQRKDQEKNAYNKNRAN